MLYYDHSKRRSFNTKESLELIASQQKYDELLVEAKIDVENLSYPDSTTSNIAEIYKGDLNLAGRYVSYTHDQEGFKFLMDPMLATGVERVSAMGYGNAINALADEEGGMAKFFFAEIRTSHKSTARLTCESEGMTLRVALGAKPNFGERKSKQIIVNSPILSPSDMNSIMSQDDTPIKVFPMLFEPVYDDCEANEKSLIDKIENLCESIETFARDDGGIVILSDLDVCKNQAPISMILLISAINQRLIEAGLRFSVSIIVQTGQISSSHHIACALGFGAAAVYPLSVLLRAEEKFSNNPEKAYKNFTKARKKL